NLARGSRLAENKDFEALGNLIGALEKIASMELRKTANQGTIVDLGSLLEELRIVVEPGFADQDIALRWEVESPLPAVWADRQSLMQVFLNLTRNSERALRDRPLRELLVRTSVAPERVSIRFQDTGGGVSNPERLFRPFQQQARATGLGLYLSRAFMRSFRGDLRYEQEPDGSSFIVDLTPAAAGNEKYEDNTDSARGRSQPVPREPQPVA
ncbi:MAG: HAMP domain-containing histidine kinase, partial [Acidobacteriota bacterium]|nr:HAMP domain-containing histidine kinase [Acidobacteriota bacterium]